MFSAGPASAAQIERIDVDHADSRYTVEVEAVLDVPAGDAFAVMTEYELLPQINPSVIAVKRLRGPEGRSDLFTAVRLCVGLLCKKLWQVQRMDPQQADGLWSLHAVVDPALSNLRYGDARWAFRSCGAQRTCLHFRAELEPAFWVPPLVGPWLIRRTMMEEARITSEGIERVAAQRNQPGTP